MGYLVSFELHLKYLGEGKSDYDLVDEIIEEFRQSSKGAMCAIDSDGDTAESCKWYEHDSDLKSFSKKYPDWLFTLHGEGEDNGDLWNKYFRDGYMQEAVAKVSYDEYDNSRFLATRRDDKITKVLG